MLTYYLRDTSGALATLNFDGDFVGNAQRIRWHVLRRRHLNAVVSERIADPVPIRIHEHAARVEEHGFNRHGFSLH